MLRYFTAAAFVCLLSVLPGCGGGNELGRVGDETITREEFLGIFNGLPAEEQVGVLEPSGRMELMERIVRKKLLLLAWAENPSVSSGYEDLYRISFLSDSMYRKIAMEYDPDIYLDSLAACGYSSFMIRTVLLDDSSDAVSLADEWNSGNYDISVSSLSAPWSDRSGTSYRTMRGPVNRITANFIPLLSMETGKAHVLPMYGEWCVAMLELTEGEWVEDESAAVSGLMNRISSLSHETVLASGIMALAGSCSLSGTTLVPSGEGDETPVILLESDTVTTSEILSGMRLASAENFFGGVPEELQIFSPPELVISPEVTLWFHVKSLAQRRALTLMAEDQGISLDESVFDYPRAESVVRERLLKEAIPDSAGVAQWYADNSSMFMLPERRSVLLGYTDSLTAAGLSVPDDITMISGLQTITDSTGNMVSTPLQVQESFGPLLGPEIFAAEEGVLTGPVFLDGELAGFFEVVEVRPPEVADLYEVFPVAATAAAGDLFQQGFEELIEDLKSTYPVEIDTQAVTEIDLWGSVQ